MKFLLVCVGCIECGDDTEIGNIVSESEIPENYKVVKTNSDVKVTYSDCCLAIELAG